MWKPYLTHHSFCRSACWTHSQLIYFFTASRFWLLALASWYQPPTREAALPASPNLGHGTTPKSSPSAFWMSGRAQRPFHCMAVALLTNAPGSDQSVVYPCSRPPESCSCLSPAIAETASGAAKETFLPLESNRSAPEDQSSRVAASPTPS